MILLKKLSKSGCYLGDSLLAVILTKHFKRVEQKQGTKTMPSVRAKSIFLTSNTILRFSQQHNLASEIDSEVLAGNLERK